MVEGRIFEALFRIILLSVLFSYGNIGSALADGCTASRVDINCTIYVRKTSCEPLALKRDFPVLFPHTYDGLPPGTPRMFDAKEDHPGYYPAAALLSWKPPKDTSIKDVRGFYLTVAAVSGVAVGKRWCIVFDISNHHLNREHIETLFSVPFQPVYESSVYDFYLYSLPLIDPYLESSGNVDKAHRRIITSPSVLADVSPAQWKTYISCRYEDESKIEVRFKSAPASYGFQTYDAVLLLEEEDEHEQVVDVWVNEVHQNFTIYGNRSPGEYKLLLTPKDIVKGLGQCTCKNNAGICVGYCATSVCHLSIDKREENLSPTNISCKYVDDSYLDISTFDSSDQFNPSTYNIIMTKLDINGRTVSVWNEVKKELPKSNQVKVNSKIEPGAYEIKLSPKQDEAECKNKGEGCEEALATYQCQLYITGITDFHNAGNNFLVITLTSGSLVTLCIIGTIVYVCHKYKIIKRLRSRRTRKRPKSKSHSTLHRSWICLEDAFRHKNQNKCTQSLIELHSVDCLTLNKQMDHLNDFYHKQCQFCENQHGGSAFLIYPECISLGGKSV